MNMTATEIDRLVSELRNPDFRGLMQHLRSAGEIDRLFQQSADTIEAKEAELVEIVKLLARLGTWIEDEAYAELPFVTDEELELYRSVVS